MHLDLPTLMIMESFVATCAGAALLYAWSQNRKVAVWMEWGIADLLTAGGIFCLLLGWSQHQPVFSTAGGIMLALSHGLAWKAVRGFDGKVAPLPLVLAGLLVAALANLLPGTRELSGSISLSVSMSYMIGAAISLWLGRAERLAGRWVFVILCTVHGCVLLTGAISTLSGGNGQHAVPPVMSLFGLIHFESIIFSLGTAVFLLAMVKERGEAAGLKAARIDPLTGIANRSGFTEGAERVVARCAQDGAEISVMMFDLDRFKAINDGYGHAVGDAVIRKFCELAAAGLRPNDVFGRLGGEEFAVVVPGASVEATHVRADRIRTAVAAGCRFLDGHQINATVSCGVAGGPGAERTLDALLEEADAALYCAKFEGRNRVRRMPKPGQQTAPPAVIRVA